MPLAPRSCPGPIFLGLFFSPACNMTPSLSLTLIAFLQRMRSLRCDLRSFMLRCLLLWPRILRKLRNLWSLYFRTGSIATDRKKTEGDPGGPSFRGTLPKREGYSVICASHTFDRVGEASQSHSVPRSGDIEESIERGSDVGRPPSVRSFPSSYPPSLQRSRQDSPPHSASPLRARNVYTPSHSSRAGSPVGTRELIIDHSPDPLSYSHLHATSRQFTGAYTRTRSRSPSPSLFRRRPPSSIAGVEIGVDIPPRPAVIQESHGSPEATAFPIAIQPPSRSGTMDSQAPYSPSSPSQAPVHGQTQKFPTHHGSPSAESVSSLAGSSPLRGDNPSVYGVPVHGIIHTHHSGESVHGSSLTPQPIQGTHQSVFSLPESAVSRIFLPTNVLGPQPEKEWRKIRPMHSEQVSRYAKKGDV